MTINGRQIREARILLDWTPGQLARAVFLKLDVIDQAEENAEDVCLDAHHEVSIRRALERAGVEFLADPPSVRLRNTGLP